MEDRKNKTGLKALLIGGLIFVLLLPTFMIDNLVFERKQRQDEALHEVSSKWAEKQTITGPIVTIPYLEYFKDKDGIVGQSRKFIHILPDQLKINGEIIPEKRYRGIYEIVVYSSKIAIEGNFKDILNQINNIDKANILFSQATISIGISDLRGLKEQVNLNWNKQMLSFNPGVESNDIMDSGISSTLNLNSSDTSISTFEFSFTLNLKGSQSLYFTPVGKESYVKLASNWKTPSFDGAFLPDFRSISDSGFNATWKVLNLNRNYPQSWLNQSYQVANSTFGINLYLPIDGYTKTDRSIKYAILFIGLTFLIFFFLETLSSKPIHPLQYILIGFALCLFYVLLLSISEHISYNWAYLIASFMTIGLITWYSRSILKESKLSLLVAGNLVILYGFIFVIIQLEDLSLLIGSLGLFLILVLVMYFSKKIDWTGLSKNLKD